MKTLSVKQVADVLSVSPRAVLKRLSNGQLKGTRRTNKFGVEEWWVYPNKEIRSALESSGKLDILGGTDNLSDAEVVEIEAQSFAPDDSSEPDEPAQPENNSGAWASEARGATSAVAEELWNNIIKRFLGELRERDELIGEMRSELSEKDRQLKLLPDLEKKAIEVEAERQRAEEFRKQAMAESERAEAERKSAEMKHLELEALKKQIAALQEAMGLSAKPTEDSEPVSQEQESGGSNDEIQTIAAAQAKVKELEEALDERNRLALEELKRLQEEKDSENAAIKAQLQQLSEQLAKSQRPWWKKFFATS